MINYFNFKRMNNQILLTNDFGRYIFLEPKEFKNLLKDDSQCEMEKRKVLEEKGFVYFGSKTSFTEDGIFAMRDAKNYLFQSTQLHIFVVTTACNGKCVYCQAQNGTEIPCGMMTEEVAKKAVDIALQSPSKNLQFEFQGGEPLLNFDVIRFIVEYSKENAKEKEIRYSVVTNLTLLTDEILEYFINNEVNISTSLDGNMTLHNENRPYRNGKGTFEDMLPSLEKIRKKNVYVGALLTVTKKSLANYKEIIDSYVRLGFDTISLRSLTPLGCANKNWEEIGYSPEEFLEFYKNAFEYILEINKKGYYLKEGLASIFLRKILDGIATNYMELRSPCGAAIGQIAYYYDGNIYTCDEGRMLAEMGNPAFHLGSIGRDDYDSLMNSKVCKAVCSSSILESLPSCSECVYQPYCGVCPVVNYALDGDIFERHPNGYRCSINKGMLDLIFGYLQYENNEIQHIFRSWIR